MSKQENQKGVVPIVVLGVVLILIGGSFFFVNKERLWPSFFANKEPEHEVFQETCSGGCLSEIESCQEAGLSEAEGFCSKGACCKSTKEEAEPENPSLLGSFGNLVKQVLTTSTPTPSPTPPTTNYELCPDGHARCISETVVEICYADTGEKGSFDCATVGTSCSPSSNWCAE